MNTRLILTTSSALVISAGLNTAFAETVEKGNSGPAPRLEFCQVVPTTATKAAVPGAMITKEWKVPANTIPPSAAAAPEDREATKKWFISKGIVFNGDAVAEYNAQNGRLVVRNTQDQIDRIDAILKLDQAPREPVKQNVNDPVIPKLELKGATPSEAFKVISAATGIKVFYTPPAPPARETTVTLSLSNISASQAFTYVTRLANLKFSHEKDGVHVSAR
jgi:hypothetical protein